MTTGSTEALLAERSKQHGDFSDHARVSQSLKATMTMTKNWGILTPVMKEALEMIQHKVARILSGDPTHQDHWDDIAGYAKLTSDRIVHGTNEHEFRHQTDKKIGGVGAYGNTDGQADNL